MPEVRGQVSKFRHSLFYLRRVSETGSHAPPDPSHAAWRRDNCMITGALSYALRNAKVKGQPLPSRRIGDQVIRKCVEDGEGGCRQSNTEPGGCCGLRYCRFNRPGQRDHDYRPPEFKRGIRNLFDMRANVKPKPTKSGGFCRL